MTSLCNLSKKIWKIKENYRKFWVSKFHNSWTSGWILIYISKVFFLLSWHFLEYNTFLNYENLSISKKVIFVFVSWNLLKSFCHDVTDNFHESRNILELPRMKWKLIQSDKALGSFIYQNKKIIFVLSLEDETHR